MHFLISNNVFEILIAAILTVSPPSFFRNLPNILLLLEPTPWIHLSRSQALQPHPQRHRQRASLQNHHARHLHPQIHGSALQPNLGRPPFLLWVQWAHCESSDADDLKIIWQWRHRLSHVHSAACGDCPGLLVFYAFENADVFLEAWEGDWEPEVEIQGVHGDYWLYQYRDDAVQEQDQLFWWFVLCGFVTGDLLLKFA